MNDMTPSLASRAAGHAHTYLSTIRSSRGSSAMRSISCQGSHNGGLFAVTTTDPATLAAAFVGLQLVALMAAGLPARQVTRVDPMRTLTE